jgi:hypothetical protein
LAPGPLFITLPVSVHGHDALLLLVSSVVRELSCTQCRTLMRTRSFLNTVRCLPFTLSSLLLLLSSQDPQLWGSSMLEAVTQGRNLGVLQGFLMLLHLHPTVHKVLWAPSLNTLKILPSISRKPSFPSLKPRVSCLDHLRPLGPYFPDYM